MEALLTVRDVWEWLGVSEETVREMANRRELPSVRFGRTIRFRRARLEEWLSSWELCSGSSNVRF